MKKLNLKSQSRPSITNIYRTISYSPSSKMKSKLWPS